MNRENPDIQRPVSTWMLVAGTLIAAILVSLLVFDLVNEGRISGVFGAVAVLYALLYITLVKQYIWPPNANADANQDGGADDTQADDPGGMREEESRPGP